MNKDLIELNETNSNSKGGTELLQERLYDGKVSRDLLEQFQIIFSRVRSLDESKYRILYCHDLAGDPENNHLKNEGWKKFHMIVFVSNWQMQSYINYYGIPWSKCCVIKNSVDITYDPVSTIDKNIKLIYTPTPHRGLNILAPVFFKLSEKHDNIELDVFSSFKLYGWEERDNQYKELFHQLQEHPKVNYHGTRSNEEVRSALAKSHIFAYPSIWHETSCLCLIEAMMAGLACVHPNLAALPETASNWTYMYQWNEDINSHATSFYGALDSIISNSSHLNFYEHRSAQSSYARNFYSWENRYHEWTALLTNIAYSAPSKKIESNEFFTFSTDT